MRILRSHAALARLSDCSATCRSGTAGTAVDVGSQFANTGYAGVRTVREHANAVSAPVSAKTRAIAVAPWLVRTECPLVVTPTKLHLKRRIAQQDPLVVTRRKPQGHHTAPCRRACRMVWQWTRGIPRAPMPIHAGAHTAFRAVTTSKFCRNSGQS